MVRTFSSPVFRSASTGRFVAGQAAIAVGAILAALAVLPGSQAAAQRPVHYFNRGVLPLGAIGGQQLLRGGPLPGYFQPAEVEAPEGASISLAVNTQFLPSRKGSIKAGMLIGQVYFFRVTGIRHNEGFEVFPTVEVINRLYPPPGQEARFPIPIQITQEELELALDGQFVTRVVYLEDPNTALPVRDDPKTQRYFEIHPNDDPLETADRLGRPMAILRMGSRIPSSSESSATLGDRGAPMILFPPVEEVPAPAARPVPGGAAPRGAAAASVSTPVGNALRGVPATESGTQSSRHTPYAVADGTRSVPATLANGTRRVPATSGGSRLATGLFGLNEFRGQR